MRRSSSTVAPRGARRITRLSVRLPRVTRGPCAKGGALPDASRKAPHSAPSADAQPPRTRRSANSRHKRGSHSSLASHGSIMRRRDETPSMNQARQRGPMVAKHREAPTPANPQTSRGLTRHDAHAPSRDRTRGSPPARQPLSSELHSTRQRSRGVTQPSVSRSSLHHP